MAGMAGPTCGNGARVYNQPPFPHVGPAIPAIEAALHAGMGDAVREVLS